MTAEVAHLIDNWKRTEGGGGPASKPLRFKEKIKQNNGTSCQ